MRRVQGDRNVTRRRKKKNKINTYNPVVYSYITYYIIMLEHNNSIVDVFVFNRCTILQYNIIIAYLNIVLQSHYTERLDFFFPPLVTYPVYTHFSICNDYFIIVFARAKTFFLSLSSASLDVSRGYYFWRRHNNSVALSDEKDIYIIYI